MTARSPWLSFHGIAALLLVGTALAFILSRHLEHLLPYFPFLILLLCPLMHVFMHKGHGSHGSSGAHHRDAEEAYRQGLEDGRKNSGKQE